MAEDEAFLAEREKLSPLIRATKEFTGSLAMAAANTTKNILHYSGRDKHWPIADGKMRVHRVKGWDIGEYPDTIKIQNLSLHTSFEGRRLWRRVVANSISMHASFGTSSSVLFKGILNTSGHSVANVIDAPPTEYAAFSQSNALVAEGTEYNKFETPLEQLTSHHVGMLASGLCVANALNLLATAQGDKVAQLAIPSISNLKSSWVRQGAESVVEDLLSKTSPSEFPRTPNPSVSKLTVVHRSSRS